jgi:hypothetical protein
MKEVKEILQLIKKGILTLSLSDTVGEQGVHHVKMNKLLDALDAGSIDSDEEGAQLLFPEDKTGGKYRSLKSDLKTRLYSAVMNINSNQTKFNDYQRSYYQCHKQWVVVKILTGVNANTSAVALANRLLKQAEKYHFTLLCMDITSYLRIQYGVREANEKKSVLASTQFAQYFELYQAELLAEQYYTDLTIKLANNQAAKGEANDMAIRYSEAIEAKMHTQSSYKLQMYGYLVRLLRYSTMDDYPNALVICSEALDYFRSLPYEANIPLQIFNYQILVCHIQMGQFKEAEAVAKDCISLFAEGSFNWFKYQDLYFLLLLHTAEYEKAGALLKYIINHPKLEFLPDNMKELWGLYEAYIHYLSLCGKVSTSFTKKFKLSKFINDASILTKDKGGRNIAIIIVRLLILLRAEKFPQILDEMETIHQYCYNYLRGNQTKRSFTLIKMLLAVPLAQFDPERIADKVSKHIKVLEESKFDILNQTYEIEILPFEVLWQLGMEGLAERKERLQKKKTP